MNAPFGNSITTAEHAIAMMFACARQIPNANLSTHLGKWEKSKFMGMELTGKSLGIIGCGNIAEHSFAPSLRTSSQTELVAVCRRDLEAAQAFATRFGSPRAYSCAEDLVNDPEVEAVIVATPTDTHHAFSCLAAKHGKHVLCEKPIEVDIDAANEMVEVSQQSDKQFMVAHVLPFFPEFN